MKILHTADWHLGHKLYERERYTEHQAFLQWLLETIETQKIDLLIVAGDVFDVPNPPNKAMELYYSFLAQLLQSHCQHAVIVGGNHDSVFSLDAPKELLKFMRLHIVGGVTENIENELIELKDKQGNLQAVVAAVPFLRDKDINYDKNDSDKSTREQQIVTSISQHYQNLARLIEQGNYPKNIPFLATGHLFAQGCTANSDNQNEDEEAERKIYMGSLGIVSSDAFPNQFHYIALGHLHRLQQVGARPIHYSGSPIPLSFSERQDEKAVLTVEFEDNKLINMASIPIPSSIHNQLKRFEGTLNEVREAIESFEAQTPTWAEVLLHLEQPTPHAQTEIETMVSKKANFELLKNKVVSIANKPLNWGVMHTYQHLKEISVQEVFQQRCYEAGYTKEETTKLMPLFEELMEMVRGSD